MKVNRREFLKVAGALTVVIPFSSFAQAKLPGSLANNRMLSSWLAINPDGTVTIFTGKIELGQGIATAIAQIAADELDVDYGRIAVVTGDTARTPNEGVTAGSLSVENSGSAVRYACAEARSLLVAAAATKLGAPAEALKVADGTIVAPDGKRTTYWEVTNEAMLKREATAAVKPKPPAEYKYVGKSQPRRDVPKKFTGQPAYVQDLRLPGMLHARVVRPPMPGAQLVAFDAQKIRSIPGFVAVTRDGNFLAVICEREELVVKARAALAQAAQWKTGELPLTLADAAYRDETRASVVNEKTSDAKAVKRIDARYTRPYQLHASLGPSCAVAQWSDGKLKVWTHSQGVFPLRGDMARALKLSPQDITCTHLEGAGCYGQNGADDVAFDAALAARAAPGRPVRLQWMRDDEFMWEPFGSAMIVRMSAGLDAAGRIADWQHELWSYPHSTRPGGQEGVNLLAAWHVAEPAKPSPANDVPQPSGGSDRNSIPLYVFPGQRISKHYMPEAPLRTSALRTLGAYANIFALESFMDEAALAAGADPVEFRLRHLEDQRARDVIEAAAKKAGWKAGAKPTESGGMLRGRGIGFAKYKNLASYCAVIADVEVERKTGRVKVTRAVSAVDAGLAVNPDGIANQVEGGIIQSASWTLKEALKFDRQGVKTRSWADYPILRFSEVPAVEVELIQRLNERSLGVGETSQGPAAAAIANAFAHATGRRLRDIPFTPEKVKAVLA